MERGNDNGCCPYSYLQYLSWNFPNYPSLSLSSSNYNYSLSCSCSTHSLHQHQQRQLQQQAFFFFLFLFTPHTMCEWTQCAKEPIELNWIEKLNWSLSHSARKHHALLSVEVCSVFRLFAVMVEAGEDCCVKVAVHVRPLIGEEKVQGCKDCVSVVAGKPQVHLLNAMCHWSLCNYEQQLPLVACIVCFPFPF